MWVVWAVFYGHPGLARSPVGLAGVAADAGDHTIDPAGNATVGPGGDMINCQFFGAWPASAVLAGEMIPLEEIPAAECDRTIRQPVVVCHRDDFGNPQPK